MNALLQSALREADKVRMEVGYNIYDPLNIFDVATKLGLSVRFTDINMEGMYVGRETSRIPTILISHKRPLPRRVFTCAHELGHHRFNHGSRVDEMEARSQTATRDTEEQLVDSFAGALLMPTAGIQAVFVKKRIRLSSATPLEFFTVSSVFGVGFQTLVTHCWSNELINGSKYRELSKYKPANMLNDLIGESGGSKHFKLFDNSYLPSVIDMEVDNYLIVPNFFSVEGDHFRKAKEVIGHSVFVTVKPGISRLIAVDGLMNSFVRIQKARYIGLSQYRHLESQKAEVV